jgi:hypothetical protein
MPMRGGAEEFGYLGNNTCLTWGQNSLHFISRAYNDCRLTDICFILERRELAGIHMPLVP